MSENKDVHEVLLKIMKANNEIFQETQQSGANSIYFYGEKSYKYCDEFKSYGRFENVNFIKVGKMFMKPFIKLVSYGTNLKMVELPSDNDGIKQVELVLVKDIQPDVIRIIEL